MSYLDNEFILKLTVNNFDYRNEIYIYRELTEVMHNDRLLDNKIVKLYNDGMIETRSEEYEFDIGGSLIQINNRKNRSMFSRINKLFESRKNTTNIILYSIQEYNPNYILLKDVKNME